MAGADRVMTRMSAPDRLRRLLSVLPWVAGVGGASLDDIAIRFDYPRELLERDLIEIVQFVGVYPYTPGDLIEVFIDPDTGHVTINYADYFRQALRLTPEQALALVGAGAGLVRAAGDDTGPLARGIEKLAGQLGISVGESVDIQLGSAAPAVLAAVRDAVERSAVLRIDYYSHGRDSRSERDIEPSRVFSRDGAWYVSAHCRLADGNRVFRLDRMSSATVTDERFVPRSTAADDHFAPAPEDPRVTIDLDLSAEWVADYYPVESIERRDSGGAEVTLAVTAPQWIERLLLQLGPHADVKAVSGDLPLDIAAQAARRVLQRYQS